MFTVQEIAEQMGKSGRWVRYLCINGKLNAVKHGNAWMILEAWK
jgi:excisionase family DNA binding protein